GNRAAHLRADLHDLGAGGDDARLLTGLAGIVEDVRVEVAVAGMEDVADAQAVRGGDLVDAGQDLRQLRPRDHAVHRQVRGRAAAVGAEGRLAALPQQLPLGLVRRRADLARARFATGLHDALRLRLQALAQPVHLDQERCGGVARVTATKRVL